MARTSACANWRRPLGKGSHIGGLDEHPVVQVGYRDAEAYATWVGKALPTEAEWEFAARGGLKDKPYVWGDEERPGGKIMCNHWQGKFPERVLELAVKRMLPGGPLKRQQMTHLKIYGGAAHPHDAQNPKKLDIKSMNPKNAVRG